MNKYLKISPEVQFALDNNRPVVALESTIISHGMPYPQNVQTAETVENIIRDNGCVPATIAIINGVMTVGCTSEEIDMLGRAGTTVPKVSRRDLPVIIASGSMGATTVATTMYIAHLAGIDVFATGGLGGAHRNSEKTSLHSCQIYKICRIAKQHHHSAWLSKLFMSYRTAPQEHTAQDCHNCINHKPALKRYRTYECNCSYYKEYIENIAADYISYCNSCISLTCC